MLEGRASADPHATALVLKPRLSCPKPKVDGATVFAMLDQFTEGNWSKCGELGDGLSNRGEFIDRTRPHLEGAISLQICYRIAQVSVGDQPQCCHGHSVLASATSEPDIVAAYLHGRRSHRVPGATSAKKGGATDQGWGRQKLNTEITPKTEVGPSRRSNFFEPTDILRAVLGEFLQVLGTLIFGQARRAS